MHKPPPSKIGLFEIGAILGCFGVVWWFAKHHASGGSDLMPALGFSYGPMGNLPGIAGGFRTGNVSGLLSNGAALPVILTPPTIAPTFISDIGGTTLTDLTGTGLSDVTGHGVPPGNVPSHNAAGIKSSFNYSGSKPS
jgi:hypothetical protein